MLSKTGNKYLQLLKSDGVRSLTDYILEHLDRQMSTGALFIDLKKARNFQLSDREFFFLSQNTFEEAVWIGSGTILPHELKESNLK